MVDALSWLKSPTCCFLFRAMPSNLSIVESEREAGQLCYPALVDLLALFAVTVTPAISGHVAIEWTIFALTLFHLDMMKGAPVLYWWSWGRLWLFFNWKAI